MPSVGMIQEYAQDAAMAMWLTQPHLPGWKALLRLLAVDGRHVGEGHDVLARELDEVLADQLDLQGIVLAASRQCELNGNRGGVASPQDPAILANVALEHVRELGHRVANGHFLALLLCLQAREPESKNCGECETGHGVHRRNPL